MTMDRKQAARLRRRRRQQQPHHEHLFLPSVEYTCGECGDLIETLSIAGAMDWIEHIVLHESEVPSWNPDDVAHLSAALRLLRTALHLPVPSADGPSS
jgi:hypothetical protein